MSFSKNLEVILVEDDPYDAELLMRVFKKHSFGSKVVILKDGAEAIDYFFKNTTNGESCENKARIAFLDLKMPRVDGIEVLRRLRSDIRTKNMPIIILTGSKEERDLKNAFALGVTSYITKPLKSEQFVSLMSQLGAKLDAVERKVCILVLEDDSAEAELIKRELQKSICNVAVEIVPDKDAFQAALAKFTPDLFLTDYNVPGFNGIAAMYSARQRFPDIPTIIVSGTMGDELAVEALKSGANDYVLKSRISRLGPVTNRALLEAKQVAERKKAEQEAKQAKEKAEKYLDIVGNIVLALDIQGRITLLNKKAYEILGYKNDELLGKNWIEACLPPEVRAELTSVFENWVQGKIETPLNYEIPIITKNGERRIISWHNSDIRDQNGKLIGTLSSGEDITKRKQTEEALKHRTEELEQTQIKLENKAAEVEEYASRMEELAEERARQLKDAERLATIGATAGMVGHDIRNPLQAISGDIYLLRSDLSVVAEGKDKESMKESLDEIEDNIGYINKIVQDLQDYARPLNPKTEEADLQQLIEKIFSKNGLPKNVKATLKIESEVAKIYADPYYVNRIMYNLITNAVQAMPKGGKLTVQAYKEAKGTVIEVEDTGVGIPVRIRDKLFTPMFTTKSKGQGFGLAVVKRMTEALGGTVCFDSEEGKGTTFILRFPNQKE